METKRIIKEVDLVADSVRKAQYHLSLCELGGRVGYVVTKTVGACRPGKAYRVLVPGFAGTG